MAIPVVETTAISNQTANATSKSDVTSPSGVLADDIVLIFIAMDGDAANPEADADGFATLTSFPEGADEIYILWKRSTGSEPANYTVNWTGAEQARFMTVRVSGCITTGDPWDVISAGVSNSASTTNVINRLISTVIDTLALYAVAVDRNRVDGADTITGTGWTEVGTSGSSGGANGVGLIVGKNDMPLVEQVEAGTFGTWASDQNASRGFNLKPPVGPLVKIADEVLEHVDSALPVLALVRIGSDILDHVESAISKVELRRIADEVLEHIDSALKVSGFAKIGSEVLEHVDSAISVLASAIVKISDEILDHVENSVIARALVRIGETIISTLHVISLGGEVRLNSVNVFKMSSGLAVSEGDVLDAIRITYLTDDASHGGGNCTIGVYDQNRNLLTETDEVNVPDNVGEVKIRFPITPRFTIPAGVTNVFPGIFPQNANHTVKRAQAGATIFRDTGNTYPTLPDPFTNDETHATGTGFFWHLDRVHKFDFVDHVETAIALIAGPIVKIVSDILDHVESAISVLGVVKIGSDILDHVESSLRLLALVRIGDEVLEHVESALALVVSPIVKVSDEILDHIETAISKIEVPPAITALFGRRSLDKPTTMDKG